MVQSLRHIAYVGSPRQFLNILSCCPLRIHFDYRAGGAPSSTWPIHVPLNEAVQWPAQVQSGIPQHSHVWFMLVVSLPGKWPGMHGIHTLKTTSILLLSLMSSRGLYYHYSLCLGSLSTALRILDERFPYDITCSKWTTCTFLIWDHHCSYIEAHWQLFCNAKLFLKYESHTGATWGGSLQFLMNWRHILSSVNSTRFSTVSIPSSWRNSLVRFASPIWLASSKKAVIWFPMSTIFGLVIIWKLK